MGRFPNITVLGGGPAGLAAGYYAKKRGLSFVIYEASARVGGNAITMQHGDFRFDSGAHRFHHKDSKVTEDLRGLLGKDFKQISVPSHIYLGGKCIDFPLSFLDVLVKLGLPVILRGGLELIGRRIGEKRADRSFESFALKTYGDTLAQLFLLNYSEKLWGRPASELSEHISGNRLKGLNLMTFVNEALFGKKAKTLHLDGLFYYPKMGYGTITEKLADFCGKENTHRNSRVTRIFHDCSRIHAVEINGREHVDVKEVVSTLPLPLFVRLMDPRPEQEILGLASELGFRNLILVAVFLNKDGVTESGTVYFPEADFPFTRVFEPKNRSRYMSPSGETSLCAEIPCSPNDAQWTMREEELVQLVSSHLIRIGWIREEDIIGATVVRLSHAYPFLKLGAEEKVQKLLNYLETISNLKSVGRNARFLHCSVDDIMKSGMKVIEEWATGKAA